MKKYLKVIVSLLLLIGLFSPISADGETITTNGIEEGKNTFDIINSEAEPIDDFKAQGFLVDNKLEAIAQAIKNDTVNELKFFYASKDLSDYKDLPLSTKTEVSNQSYFISGNGLNIEGVMDTIKKNGFEKIGNSIRIVVKVYAEKEGQKIQIGYLNELDKEATFTFKLPNSSPLTWETEDLQASLNTPAIQPNREYGMIDFLRIIGVYEDKDTIPVTVNVAEGTFTFSTKVPSDKLLLLYKDVPVADTSSSCSLKDDKNCDGVVTCDEVNGIGWTWNEDKKACVFVGTTNSSNSNVYIVNTSTK